MDDATEKAIWEFINGAGWYWWGPVAALAALNLWSKYRLAAPTTFFGRTMRACAILGCLLIALSPLNTSFGPLGLPLVLIASFGVDLQLYRACKDAGIIGRKVDGPTTVKLASMIVQK